MTTFYYLTYFWGGAGSTNLGYLGSSSGILLLRIGWGIFLSSTINFKQLALLMG